jgi:hypothetical protein
MPPAEAPEGREPGFFGVSAAPLDQETRAFFQVPDDVEGGVVLLEVVEGSPAAKAGLQNGDVLVSFEGRGVKDFEELRERIAAHAAGDEVAYVARRGAAVLEGKVQLARRMAGEFLPFDLEPMPPEGAPGDLQERLDRVQRDLGRLRERLEARTARRHPRSLGGWIHQEEMAARAARARGDEEKFRWHSIRLGVLREMQEAGAAMPAQRLDRIEEKLDQILAAIHDRK